MLTALRAPVRGDAEYFAHLRTTEFAALDEQRLCYLDYTGAAIPGRSQLETSAELMATQTFGNPHSEHIASRRSTEAIEAARQLVLDFIDADARTYAVCFTANTSAAIKLVAESFGFDSGSTVVLSADNHNSVNGIGEYARRAGAKVRTIPLTAELRLRDTSRMLGVARGPGKRLLAFPAQSNFSGVKHPLALIAEAQRRGYSVLLDAAAYLPSNALSLRRVQPEFVVMSMYKLFGFPTGVGALVVRRDALARLERPWFAGGTVDWASVRYRRHRLRSGVEAFEDGTPNYAGIAAVASGFALLDRVGMSRIAEHVQSLTALLLDELQRRRHSDGSRVFRVYGPMSLSGRGGTISFNVVDASGTLVHYERVEEHAARHGVAIRGGCFCNPGAAEAAFEFPARLVGCLDTVGQEDFSPGRLRECLGGETAVGAVRASVGLANTATDIRRGVAALAAMVQR